MAALLLDESDDLVEPRSDPFFAAEELLELASPEDADDEFDGVAEDDELESEVDFASLLADESLDLPPPAIEDAGSLRLSVR